MNDDYDCTVTITEAARTLDLSKQRVWQLLRKKGVIRAVKRGPIWFLSADGLRKEVARREVKKKAKGEKP